MPPLTLDTTHLHQFVRGWQTGDRAAADALLAVTVDRVERLVRRMLPHFPVVQSHADAADVQQGCLLRLLKALRAMCPNTPHDFYCLVAVQVRRELIDLSRYHACRPAVSLGCGEPVDRLDPLDADAPPPPSAEELEEWDRFHRTVERLPAVQREVLSLVFYHRWKHRRIAALLQVSERTVRRHWRAAVLAVAEQMDQPGSPAVRENDREKMRAAASQRRSAAVNGISGTHTRALFHPEGSQ